MYKNQKKTPPFADYGGTPALINVKEAARQNTAYRRALWTGTHLQMTVMCIPVGEDIGTEMHPNLDQCIRVEEGTALVRSGSCRSAIGEDTRIGEGTAFFIPAGTYHNVINAGRTPLRLSSFYAPPTHPRGTVHVTREDAMHHE